MYKAVYFFKLIIISFDTLWKEKFKKLYGYKELRMLKKRYNCANKIKTCDAGITGRLS